MFKKIIAFLLLSFIIFSMFSCSNEPKTNITSQSSDITKGTDDETKEVIVEICEYKNGASGAVYFSYDDGLNDTATWIKNNYPNMPVSYAMVGNKIAALRVARDDSFTYVDENGNTRINKAYVIDENGKFKYSLKNDEVAFWQDILDTTYSELLCHSFTHEYTGFTDNGGLAEGAENVLPARSISADLIGCKQLLQDTFGDRNGLIFAYPGVGVSRNKDSHPEFYNIVYDNFLASRDSGDIDAELDYTTFALRKYALPQKSIESATYGEYGEAMYEKRNEQFANWCDYIDGAISNHYVAGFLAHSVGDGYIATTTDHMKALFDHAISKSNTGNLWIGTISEIVFYMEERLASKINVVESEESISIDITNELDAIYDEPLTIHLHIPYVIDDISVEQNGKLLELSKTINNDNTMDVFINVVPNAGEIVASK